MKKNIKSVLSLTIICAFVSVLLAVTNSITAPLIKEQENAAVNDSLKIVLPTGEDFQLVDISDKALPETVVEAYSEKNGGYVFKLKTAGYGSDLTIMCGINKEGTVTGVQYISGNETLGVETTYGEKLVNATSETVESVEIVAGATKTSGAMKNAAKDALNAAIVLGGGSVDLRDEATILNDNLSEALPAGEGKFTKLFVAEDIGDVTAVYSADNGAGYVFSVGEGFVATDSKGVVLSQVEEAINTKVTAAAKSIINSKLTEIDITGFADMPSQVKKVHKTDSGNYVLELNAAGYGINGDKYTRSNEYIVIKVSVTPKGKIIACETLSQKESEGIGDACGEPEFYNQFNGKTAADYGEIDAIAGATITTNGYKTAISKVFEAVTMLKGGAN